MLGRDLTRPLARPLTLGHKVPRLGGKVKRPQLGGGASQILDNDKTLLLVFNVQCTYLVTSVDVHAVPVHHSRVTPASLGCDHAPGGAVLGPRVLLDVKHPERSLLVIAEAQLAPEHVEDVLVLHYGVALETARALAPPTHPLPDIGVCRGVLSYHYQRHSVITIRESVIIIILRTSHNHIPNIQDLSRPHRQH